MFEIRKAKRQRRPLKVSFEGISGSGKTFSALRLAFAMKRAGIGKRIVVADSENASSELYADIYLDGEAWDYQTCQIPAEMRNPDGYRQVYEYLVQEGFDIIIIDSLSHAWHGAQAHVDNLKAASRGRDGFAAWATVTPLQRAMMETITDGRAHVISTMRVKSEYEMVADANGKEKRKKIGTKTDQRDGAEYEFDVVMRFDGDQTATVEKMRGCTALNGRSTTRPDPEFWRPLFDWWLAAEPEQAPHEKHLKALKAATTLAELQDAFKRAWGDRERMSEAELAPIVALKDARKGQFAPATAIVAPERAEMLERYRHYCTILEADPDHFFAHHARQLGSWPAGTSLPPVTSLTDAQLGQLIVLARHAFEVEADQLANPV